MCTGGIGMLYTCVALRPVVHRAIEWRSDAVVINIFPSLRHCYNPNKPAS
jgi:hypothetical protein